MSNRPLVLATLEGYAVEGGFDRPHQPTTCFSPTIALGRHAGPGNADELWADYELVLDVAADLGIDGILLGVEWARIEPRRDQVDFEALDRYREVARYARAKGLHVSVSIFGVAWPSWLGLEAWLLPWTAPHAVNHAVRVTRHLADDVDSVVLFSDAEGIVRRGFIEATAPPWRVRADFDAGKAASQISSIKELLVSDARMGKEIVVDFATVELDDSEISELRERTDLTQIHVRSLVKGSGPGAARHGLLAKHGGRWGLHSRELLEALVSN